MLVPRDRDWHRWDEVAFCKVPPAGRVDYDPMKGAQMDTLTIDLFGRGMGPLHRAGLGGLACTLVRLDWPESEWSLDDDGRRLNTAGLEDRGCQAIL